MIKSERRFGVEVEFICDTSTMYRRIQARIPVVQDGSLRPYNWGGEWVSEPLSGRQGEIAVQEACAVLKKYRADVSNPKTALHIHLDGYRGDGQLVESNKRDKDAGLVVAVSRAAAKMVTPGEISFLLNNGRQGMIGVPNVQTIDNTVYLSMGKLTRHPMMNYTFYTYKKTDRTKWLRNVLYFYTKYSDVMQAMVSQSRRVNNMYCVPLSDSFTLEEIEEIKTTNDVINVWYKGRGIGGHYDDSRYHNVNLHSYFDRHGTVEIRSHGSTIDPNKILLWVRLHQHICDKLENIELEDIKSDKDPFISFLDFLSDDPLLQNYYKRLIGYFCNITIKGEEVIRK